MKNIPSVLVLLPLLFCAVSAAEPGKAPPKAKPAAAAATALASQGKKNPLPGGGWFTWQFADKPKLGTVIIKVRLFSKDGRREKTAEIVGESGMPSMPYHDSGPVKFKLSKKGDYLLPVDVVMPGEWQLVIRVRQGAKEIYAGKVLFSI